MLAVVAAFLAAVVVFSALKKREAEMQKAIAQSVNIVVAARDIPLGTRIDPDAVKLVRWSRESEPKGAFTDVMAVAGSYANSDLVAGEPIVQAKLIAAAKAAGVMALIIPPGMRALSVPVDEVSDIAGFVKPHTRVDVLVAISGSSAEGQAFSKIVLQNVEVLAIAQQIEKGKDEPEIVKVVTLLVTPHQAEKLALASREGTLRLAMRNYGDDRTVMTAGSDIADLLGRPATIPPLRAQVGTETKNAPLYRGARPFSIEIMRDGKNSETVSFVSGLQPPGLSAFGGDRTGPLAQAVSAHGGTLKASIPLLANPAPDGSKSGSSANSWAAYMSMPKTIAVP